MCSHLLIGHGLQWPESALLDASEAALSSPVSACWRVCGSSEPERRDEGLRMIAVTVGSLHTRMDDVAIPGGLGAGAFG